LRSFCALRDFCVNRIEGFGLRLCCPVSSAVKNPELPCRGTSGLFEEMRLARTSAQPPRRNSFYPLGYCKSPFILGFPIPCREFRPFLRFRRDGGHLQSGAEAARRGRLALPLQPFPHWVGRTDSGEPGCLHDNRPLVPPTLRQGLADQAIQEARTRMSLLRGAPSAAGEPSGDGEIRMGGKYATAHRSLIRPIQEPLSMDS
jgi:hypothetical protein